MLRGPDPWRTVWTADVSGSQSSADLLLSPQTQLENFPLCSIQRCQAVLDACSYDSILALVCKESGQNKADLHLFQCDHIKVCDWPLHVTCSRPQSNSWVWNIFTKFSSSPGSLVPVLSRRRISSTPTSKAPCWTSKAAE